jgi:hypothetical protein
MKAFLSAFNILFDGNDDSNKAGGNNDESNHNDKDDDEEMDDDIYNFLAKVGSLKEYAVGWLVSTRALSFP